jgi:DNA helicase-2/ATP-dependent DNA helicase PcrA
MTASLDFPETAAVHLEENYRSTGAILAASLAVVSQGKRTLIVACRPIVKLTNSNLDKKRAAKGLYTSHGSGYPVTLKSLFSAHIEAAYIAEEIKRLIAHSGNMLDHNDFAVLREYCGVPNFRPYR